MNVFIDCEWNGHKGQLISMALVDEQGNEFYEVLPCPKPIAWVKSNIIPVLGKEPVSQSVFDQKLDLFLQRYNEIHIIADWPEDIAHFCRALVTKPLTRIGLRRMIFTVDAALFGAESEMPHNALADARAMRDYVRYLSCPE